MPWARSGPGIAFRRRGEVNLTVFNQAYFDRLRARVQQLQQNGIYAIVQLFDVTISRTYAVQYRPRWATLSFTGVKQCQRHRTMFTPGGRSGTASMTMTAANALLTCQDSLCQKGIDTLNSLPNVCGKSPRSPQHSTWWQAHMIALIRKLTRRGKPLQHPIGFPSLDTTAASDATLFASKRRPGLPRAAAFSRPIIARPASRRAKVDINDSDHTLLRHVERLAARPTVTTCGRTSPTARMSCSWIPTWSTGP